MAAGKRFAGAFISQFETHLRARNVTLACRGRDGQDILTVDQPTIEVLRQESAMTDLSRGKVKANAYSEEALGCVTNSVWISSFERGCS